MSNQPPPDFSLFFSILRSLESINTPYMIIGAFAATIYGSTRVTYDIDIVVDLNEQHIQTLAALYPLPRYYADPDQMRDSVAKGIMFNIIDTNRGEKADLVPLSMADRYRQAFGRRIRQLVDAPGLDPFEIWCARPEDVILGKLAAWHEGRSPKHENDIFEMLVFHYLGLDPALSAEFDERLISVEAQVISAEAAGLWAAIQSAARREADRP